jgi:hypothetical protein
MFGALGGFVACAAMPHSAPMGGAFVLLSANVREFWGGDFRFFWARRRAKNAPRPRLPSWGFCALRCKKNALCGLSFGVFGARFYFLGWAAPFFYFLPSAEPSAPTGNQGAMARRNEK